MSDGVRLDRWLWSVRLFRTRSDATAACRAGQVKVNGRPAKAATNVVTGDRIEGRFHGRARDVEVAREIDRRVGAAVAADCYVDHTPPEPETEPDVGIAGARDRGAGRPTKRERRQLDRLRGGRSGSGRR